MAIHEDPNEEIAVALAGHADTLCRFAVATPVEHRAEESGTRVFGLLKTNGHPEAIRALAAFCRSLGRQLDELATEHWRNS